MIKGRFCDFFDIAPIKTMDFIPNVENFICRECVLYIWILEAFETTKDKKQRDPVLSLFE